jgi:drug/metabolite transporter, DME family
VTASGARLRVFAAAACFSTGGALFKLTRLTGWQVAGFRALLAAGAVVVLLPEARRAWTWRAGLVGVAYACTTVLFVQANKLTTAASAVFLQDSSPLFILLLAPWLLKERPRREDLVFLSVAAVGMACLLGSGGAPQRTAMNPALGNALAAVSALTFALTVMGYRWLAVGSGGGSGSSGAVAAAAVSGNVLAFLFCLPFALPLGAVRLADWAIVVWLGVVQLGAGYAVLARAVPYLPALEVSLLLLLEPVLNPIWTWMVHRERPGSWTVAGGAIILGATAVKSWYDARRES